MRTLLLALLLAPLASAQTAERPPAQPNRPLLALAGAGGTLVTMTAFGAVLSATAPAEGEEGDSGLEGAVALLMLAAIPAGTALGVRLAARGSGGEPFGRTYGNAALGMLPAFAVAAIAAPLVGYSQGSNDPSTTAVLIVAGTAFIVGPAAYAAWKYRGPVPVIAYARTTDGGLVPVARLSVSF